MHSIKYSLSKQNLYRLKKNSILIDRFFPQAYVKLNHLNTFTIVKQIYFVEKYISISEEVYKSKFNLPKNLNRSKDCVCISSSISVLESVCERSSINRRCMQCQKAMCAEPCTYGYHSLERTTKWLAHMRCSADKNPQSFTCCLTSLFLCLIIDEVFFRRERMREGIYVCRKRERIWEHVELQEFDLRIDQKQYFLFRCFYICS